VSVVPDPRRFHGAPDSPIDSWTGRQLERTVIPYSDEGWKRIVRISLLHSSHWPRLAFFQHDCFEISLLVEPFHASERTQVAAWDQDCAEKAFLQWHGLFRLAHERRLDFIDLSRLALAPDAVLRLAIAWQGNQPLPAEAGLEFLRANPFLEHIRMGNMAEIALDFRRRHTFAESRSHVFCGEDFACNLLSPQSLAQVKKGAQFMIQLRIKQPHLRQAVVNHLYQELRADDLNFLRLPAGGMRWSAVVAEWLGLRESADRGSDAVADEYARWQKQSACRTTVWVCEELPEPADVEFVKYVQARAGDGSTVVVACGDSDGVGFELELHENPPNHLREYLDYEAGAKRPDSRSATILKTFALAGAPVPESRISELFGADGNERIQDLVARGYLKADRGGRRLSLASPLPMGDISQAEKAQILEHLCRSLGEKELQIRFALETRSERHLAAALEHDLETTPPPLASPTLVKTILAQGRFFRGVPRLLRLLVEIVFRSGEFSGTRELLDLLEAGDSDFVAVRRAHLFRLHREYGSMMEELKKMTTRAADLADECHYLHFVFHEKTANPRRADNWLRKIRSAYFRRRADLVLADRYIYKGQFGKCERLLREAAEYFAGHNRLWEETEAWTLLAKLFREKGNFIEAERLNKDVFVKRDMRQWRLLSAFVSVDLGNLYQEKNDFAAAGFWYKKTLELFLAEGNARGVMLARSNLADIEFVKGDWKEAQRLWRTVLAHDEVQGVGLSTAIDLFNIAHLEYLRGRLAPAVKCAERAADLFRGKDHLRGWAECQLLLEKIRFLEGKTLSPVSSGRPPSGDIRMSRRLLQAASDGKHAQHAPRSQRLSWSEQLGSIVSRRTRFDMVRLLLTKYPERGLLRILKELSASLAGTAKNYFFYEYYYSFFNSSNDPRAWDGELRALFHQTVAFFQANERILSESICRLKKRLDDENARDELFSSARLVNRSLRWQAPEDFFKSFSDQLGQRLTVALSRLRIRAGKERLFDFGHSGAFSELGEEIIARAEVEGCPLNLTVEDVRRDFVAREKIFFSYPVTRVIHWPLGGALEGFLLLSFPEDLPANYDVFERHHDLFVKFAQLFQQYYENDFQPRSKLAFIVGESPAVRALKETIQRVSRVDFSVLVSGESGSGKELIARAIHLLSARATKPFISINAANIPENLLEAELFGHRKGAFTGAGDARIGLIETADHGTLFLDEIADLPLSLQAKLLRVLQEGEIRRLGENRTIPVDIRLISASNKNLRELIQAGRFREDLFFRLQDLEIRSPPLRERLEDIPLLVMYFLRKYGFADMPSEEVSSFCERLKGYSWPGNVRELESRVKQFITFYPQSTEEYSPQAAESLKEARERFEEALIRRTLECCQWNRQQTAERLGITRMSLYNLMHKYGVTCDGKMDH